LALSRRKAGQKHGGEDRNESYHHHQFDKGESFAVCAMWFYQGTCILSDRESHRSRLPRYADWQALGHTTVIVHHHWLSGESMALQGNSSEALVRERRQGTVVLLVNVLEGKTCPSLRKMAEGAATV
jgi:hypothetical protein